MTDTTSRTWRVTAADRSYSGSATTVAEAWQNAAAAALQLAHDTSGGATLHLTVDREGEPADVEPAHSPDGALDVEATRDLLARFVDVVLGAHEEV